jgi:hypothetical protein
MLFFTAEAWSSSRNFSSCRGVTADKLHRSPADRREGYTQPRSE